MPLSSLPRGVFALLSTALAFISLSALFLLSPLPATAQSANLITNGTLDNASFWTFSNGASHSLSEGGLARVPASSNITQPFTVSESGKYLFSVSCKKGAGSSLHRFRYTISNTQLSYTVPVYLSCGSSWVAFPVYLNLPPQDYTLNIWGTDGSPYIDNVSLTKTADLIDIETGVLPNGDFITASPWSYSSPGIFIPTKGHTALGSAYLAGSRQASQQLYLEGGSYQLKGTCTGQKYSTPQVTYSFQSAELIKSFPGQVCGDDPSWITYTSPIFYLPPNTYTVSLKASNNYAVIYVDDVRVSQENSLADLNTGLIRNGDLLNKTEWTWTNTSYDLEQGSFNLGSAYFSASSSTREIKQTGLVIPTTGSYVLSFDCKNPGHAVAYKLEAPGVATISGTSSTCSTAWSTKSITRTLQANTYALTISMGAWQTSHVDDISLFPAALNDIPTGYIQNGDFIGSTPWVLGGDVLYDAKPGLSERGSLYFPSTAGQVITQSLGNLEAGMYDLTLYCSNYRIGRPGSLELHLTTAAGTFSDTFINCSADIDYPWITYTTALTLPTTVPTATLVISHTDLTGALSVYLDDVQLFRRPNLLDQQTLSCNSDLCSGSPAQGSVSGSLGQINTHSGSYSTQALDLLVPVAGTALSFSRHYASGRSQLQASGHPVGVLGQGWVHNYETRLILDDNLTTLDNSVEVQTSSGSYLPFLPQSDGSFEPYAGVLAELVENLDGTYTLTTPELLVYTFNASGQLIQQEDASGSGLTFSYNGSGQLFRATQGGRYLEYSYFTSGTHTGKLQTVTDHTGRSISFTYHTNGLLETVANPLNQATTYAYSGSTGLLTTITDPTNRVVEQISYTPAGQATTIADGSGLPALQLAYLSAHQTVISHTGAVMTHTYGPLNTLEEISFPCPDGSGSCQASAGHNSQFRHHTITDANDNPTTLWINRIKLVQ